MKKAILILLISSLVLLSSCQTQTSVSQAAEPTTAAAQPVEIAAATDPAPQASVNQSLDANQLLFGTLKLQGTDQEVTVEQASTLLPLWTNVQTISARLSPAQNPGGNQDQAQATPVAAEENTDSQNQVNEILDEIRSAMTAEQITAIDAMQINQDNQQTLMEEMGISVEQFQAGDNAQAQSGGPNGGGGRPADGSTPPDGGTPPNGAGNPPAGNGQAVQPGDGANVRGGRNDMLNPQVLSALIDYLTQRSAQ